MTTTHSTFVIEQQVMEARQQCQDDDDDIDPLFEQQEEQQQQQQHESQPYYSRRAVGLVFSVPAIGGSLFGYDIGTTSYVITQLTSSSESESNSNSMSGVEWSDWIASSPVLQGMVVAMASVGAVVGSILIFDIADKIGRRQELIYGAILYIMGTLLQTTSKCINIPYPTSWLAITVLLFGRLVYGLGIGITMHAAPTYLAEMSPPTIRGFLIAMKEATIVLGLLCGYVVGYTFSSTQGGWVYMYASSWVLSVTMLGLALFVIPKSTRWLLLVHRDDEAMESLAFIYSSAKTPSTYVQEEYARMKQMHENDNMNSNIATEEEIVVQEEEEERHDDNDDNDNETARLRTTTTSTRMRTTTTTTTNSRNKKSIWDVTYRGPLRAGLGLVILQQITGQPSILSYAAPIFQDAGLADYASILVAVFKLVATLSAATTVERLGRKPLLYAGITAMLIALIVLTIVFGIQGSGGSSTTIVETVILIAMFMYIGGYQFSFGPISWLMVGEVFPLDVRGQAVSLSGQVNFFLNAVVQFGVPILESMIGLNALFAIFAVLTAYSLYFVRMYVPETKGLSLEQIEHKFHEIAVASRRSEDAIEESIPLVDTAYYS